MHSKTTKKSAGIIFTTIAIIFLTILKIISNLEITHYFALVAGTSFLALIGLLDDIYRLPSSFRFISELIFFFSLSYYFLPEFQIFGLRIFQNSIFGSLILSVYFVFIINLTNFMDGIDMYLALTLLITVVNFVFIRNGFFLQNEYFYLMILSGVAAFMFYNYPPAKLFMGDSGSLPLGFLIAMLPFVHSNSNAAELAEIGFLIPVFLTDGTITIIKRIFAKKNIFSAHREHLFQRISDSVLTKKQTAFLFSLVNLGGGICFFLLSGKSLPIYLLFAINLLAFLIPYVYLERMCDKVKTA